MDEPPAVSSVPLEVAVRAVDAGVHHRPHDVAPHRAERAARGVRLHGDERLHDVRLQRIAAPVEKGWTNLCGITSANLAHDGSVAFLPNETALEFLMRDSGQPDWR